MTLTYDMTTVNPSIGAVNTVENGGTTLEWEIAVAELGETFTWFAATHDHIDSIVQLTHDFAAPMQAAQVPIPSTGLLFGIGLIALAARYRSKNYN